MKLRDIILCASAVMVLSIEQAQSQIERNVEVTKAYVPNIEPATKLTLMPDMSDDTYIMPDIDYSITPVSIQSTFDLTHYEAAAMNFMEYQTYSHHYVKGAFGVPLETVFDFYANSFNPNRNFMMLYLNQSGRYANIENDFGMEHSGSSQSHFRTGATAGIYVGNRGRVLRSDMSYTSDLWSRYATPCNSEYSHPLYQRLSVSGQFGGDFVSPKGFDFMLMGDVNHFWSRSGFASTGYGAEIVMGGALFGGKLLGGFGLDGVSGSSSDNFMMDGGLEYSHYGEKFRFSLGGRFYYDEVSAGGVALSSKSYFVPRLMLDYNITGNSLIAYVDVDGGLEHSDFASLSEINPYLAPGIYGDRSEVSYNFDLGIKGVWGKNDLFSYNIYASYDIIKNSRYWAFAFLSEGESLNNYFVMSQSDLQSMGLNLELEYRPNTSTTIRLEGMIAKYKDDDEQLFANGLANNHLKVEWRQRFGSRLLLGVSGDYLGSREVSCYSPLSSVDVDRMKLSSEFDLGLNLDFRIKRNLMLFGEVNNILNDNIYKWVYYREYGINFKVGAKFQF